MIYRKRCTRKHLWCADMNAALHPTKEYAARNGAGLYVVNVKSEKTGKTRTIGVVLKSSSRDEGVLLDYCPWCRASVQWGSP